MKPSRKSLRNKADKLFRDLVRSRGVCEAAGFDGVECSGNLQTMHFVSRKYLSVRWDLGNAACGCSAHHIYFTHNPVAMLRFVESYLGVDRWWELRRRAEQGKGAPDYDAVILELEAFA